MQHPQIGYFLQNIELLLECLGTLEHRLVTYLYPVCHVGKKCHLPEIRTNYSNNGLSNVNSF